MENLLLKYMSMRFNEPPVKEKGPVITISREYGCEGLELAKLIYKSIKSNSTKENHAKWMILCKKIIEDASKELNLSPEKLSSVMNSNERGIISDIISSFNNKSYYNEDNVKRAFREVIRRYAERGHVIIVGSAGCVIERNKPDTLHIRLVAPLEWRVKNIAEKYNLPLREAKKRVLDSDINRNNYLRYFDCNFNYINDYDIIFNRSIFSNKSIVSIIIKILKKRKYI